jgi:hypothetical protein
MFDHDPVQQHIDLSAHRSRRDALRLAERQLEWAETYLQAAADVPGIDRRALTGIDSARLALAAVVAEVRRGRAIDDQ